MNTKQIIDSIVFEADDDEVVDEVMHVLRLNRTLGFLYGLAIGLFVSMLAFYYLTSRIQQIVYTPVPQTNEVTMFVGRNYGQQIAYNAMVLQNAPGNAPGETLQRTQHSIGLQGSWSPSEWVK